MFKKMWGKVECLLTGSKATSTLEIGFEAPQEIKKRITKYPAVYIHAYCGHSHSQDVHLQMNNKNIVYIHNVI